jgi:hypothetical protein
MKDIKDYLHLYYGCESFHDSRTVKKIDGTLLKWLAASGEQPSLYKPILRPLSSMNKDEAIEFCRVKFRYGDPNAPEVYTNSFGQMCVSFGPGIKDKRCPESEEYRHPEEIRWLLRNGFDIFSLIEDGLAIELTNKK